MSVVAVVALLLFATAFWLSGVHRAAVRVFATSRSAFAAMQQPELDDRAREKAVQGASVQLIGQFASIVVRSAVAVLTGALPIWLADSAGIASSEAVLGFLSRWDVILVSTGMMLLAYWAWMRSWESS